MLHEDPSNALDTTEVDAAVREVHAAKDAWATASLDERMELLETLRVNTLRVADDWVAAAVAAKGIPVGAPVSGEEWASGPWALMEASSP